MSSKHITKISVIIATYRRRSQLLDVLNDLSLQTVQPDEVIVVDASPEDYRLEHMDLLKFRKWIKYLIFDQSIGNASAQRNQAIKLSVGDLIIFIDDDVKLAHQFIAEYVEAFYKTKADGIAGKIVIPGKKLDPVKPITRYTCRLFNPGAPNYIGCEFQSDTYVICTANFAVYRKCLMDVGGFDENIFGTIDDVDLGLRLVTKGYHIVHYPKPEVIHYMLTNSGSRSTEYKLSWSMANAFYFQNKNFPNQNLFILLVTTLIAFCRPSRVWFKPKEILSRISSIIQGYQEGRRRMRIGPLLIGK